MSQSNRNLDRWDDEDLIPEAERAARAAGHAQLRESSVLPLPALSDSSPAGYINWVGVFDFYREGAAKLYTVSLTAYDDQGSPGDVDQLAEMKVEITFGAHDGQTQVIYIDLIVGTSIVVPASFIRIRAGKVKTFAGAETFTKTPRVIATVAEGAIQTARPQFTVLSQPGSLAAGASVNVSIPTFAKSFKLSSDTPANAYRVQEMNPSGALAYLDFTIGANQLSPEFPVVGLARIIKITNSGLVATTKGPWLIFEMGL